MIENYANGPTIPAPRFQNELGAQDLDIAKRAKERALGKDAVDEDRDAAASAFQMLLATQLVKELRKTLPEGLFGGGAGADVYESWFDQHISEVLAEGDALGLAGMIKAGVGSMEEAAKKAVELGDEPREEQGYGKGSEEEHETRSVDEERGAGAL